MSLPPKLLTILWLLVLCQYIVGSLFCQVFFYFRYFVSSFIFGTLSVLFLGTFSVLNCWFLVSTLIAGTFSVLWFLVLCQFFDCWYIVSTLIAGGTSFELAVLYYYFDCRCLRPGFHRSQPLQDSGRRRRLRDPPGSHWQGVVRRGVRAGDGETAGDTNEGKEPPHTTVRQQQQLWPLHQVRAIKVAY